MHSGLYLQSFSLREFMPEVWPLLSLKREQLYLNKSADPCGDERDGCCACQEADFLTLTYLHFAAIRSVLSYRTCNPARTPRAHSIQLAGSSLSHFWAFTLGKVIILRMKSALYYIVHTFDCELWGSKTVDQIKIAIYFNYNSDSSFIFRQTFWAYSFSLNVSICISIYFEFSFFKIVF